MLQQNIIKDTIEEYPTVSQQIGCSPTTLEEYKIHPQQLEKWLCERGITQSEKESRLRLSEVIKLYMKYCYTLSPKTQKIYREHLHRLTVVLGNESPLDQIDRWQMIDFMSGLRDRKGQEYSPGYQHQIYRSLHTFFEFCLKQEWLTKNPMNGVPKPKIDDGPKPCLSLDQVKKLLLTVKTTTILDKRNIAIVLLMVDSGLRLNEVARLRLIDIKMDERTAYILPGKTRRSREVPLSDETITALQNYLQVRLPCLTETVFLTRDKRPLSDGAIHLLMKRLQKRLGFHLHAHLLRHTFANTYNRRGNLRKLQKIMGHSRIDTTARYYTDPEMADIQAEHAVASPTAQLKDK